MKLTKWILFSVILFCSSMSNGANVVWDCFTSSMDAIYPGTDKTVCSITPTGAYMNYGFLYFDKTSGFYTVTLTSYADPLLGSYQRWVQVSKGDVISYDTMMNRDDYFMATFFGEEAIANQSITFDRSVDKSIYLAVMIDEIHPSNDGSVNFMPEVPYQYGWVELTVAGAFVMVQSSAFALDGSAMIAGGGAVPEPSSGILLLIGSFLLMLKRKIA